MMARKTQAEREAIRQAAQDKRGADAVAGIADAKAQGEAKRAERQAVIDARRKVDCEQAVKDYGPKGEMRKMVGAAIADMIVAARQAELDAGVG